MQTQNGLNHLGHLAQEIHTLGSKTIPWVELINIHFRGDSPMDALQQWADQNNIRISIRWKIQTATGGVPDQVEMRSKKAQST